MQYAANVDNTLTYSLTFCAKVFLKQLEKMSMAMTSDSEGPIKYPGEPIFAPRDQGMYDFEVFY